MQPSRRCRALGVHDAERAGSVFGHRADAWDGLGADAAGHRFDGLHRERDMRIATVTQISLSVTAVPRAIAAAR